MKISASIMTKDDKYKNIEKLNDSKVDYIHLDVIDGKFVRKKYLSLKELPKVLTKIKKDIDVHLMVKDPTKYISLLASYDISYITIHYEIDNLEKYITMIKNDTKSKVGIAINPETDINNLYPLLDKIDLVLIMGVTPGYSGQTFKKYCGLKVKELKKELEKRKLKVEIEVDGGINDTILEYVKDADILVSASYILNDLTNIDKLR